MVLSIMMMAHIGQMRPISQGEMRMETRYIICQRMALML